MLERQQNLQNIAWFNDLNKRGRLNLDPPYQRRSVWNRKYREAFIDTILLGYPAPAIFLYQEISDEGVAKYNVVDGKQRLTTIFDFVDNVFPVGEDSEIVGARCKYFSDLDSQARKGLWSYQFLIEYLPSSEEPVIKSIFDRLNRNTAKLTAQELRHARFSGEFITSAESLSETLWGDLSEGFPRIVRRSKMQMKDVELTAQLLLLLERGPLATSQADLDEAFSDRDAEWAAKLVVEGRFRKVVQCLSDMLNSTPDLVDSRLRNQADFYSLFGAISAVLDSGSQVEPRHAGAALLRFAKSVEDESLRSEDEELTAYYGAARSASNDTKPRETRIRILKSVLEESIAAASNKRTPTRKKKVGKRASKKR